MLEETLQKFGLSDKEVKIYMASLGFETASAGDMAKKTGINRSTTYVLLDSLKKKNLMVSAGEGEKEGGVMLFSAVSPERLLQFAEESAKKYAELVSIAHTILPELRFMHKGSKKKSKVKYFEGKDGLKSAHEDVLTSKEKHRLSPEILIYDNKISLTSLVEEFALIIESEELSRAFKKLKVRS